MVIFQVLVNGEVVQQLPVLPKSSVGTRVYWMDNPASAEHQELLRLKSRGHDYSDEGTGAAIREWPPLILEVGDEVTIRLLEASEDTILTAPDLIWHPDKTRYEDRERERYEELKAKFEGGAEPK